MQNLPAYIWIVFLATALTTLWLFASASLKPGITLRTCLLWIILQLSLAGSGFYLNTEGFPPRFVLLVLPPLLLIIWLLASAGGRRYLDRFDMRKLTILHSIRIPVEIVLFLLFANGAVPELMTFEGRNFDILSGLTAPLLFWFGFKDNKPKRSLLLVWNLICLALLMNIVINAALSVPGPLQQQAFDQPNQAILHAPFNLLPALVVPLVLLSHLISLRMLLKQSA